jgi:hypothetical protein
MQRSVCFYQYSVMNTTTTFRLTIPPTPESRERVLANLDDRPEFAILGFIRAVPSRRSNANTTRS